MMQGFNRHETHPIEFTFRDNPNSDKPKPRRCGPCGAAENGNRRSNQAFHKERQSFGDVSPISY